MNGKMEQSFNERKAERSFLTTYTIHLFCMFAGILVAFFCAMSYAKGIFMFRDIPRMGHFILIGIAGMDFLLYHVYQYIQRKIKGRKKSCLIII